MPTIPSPPGDEHEHDHRHTSSLGNAVSVTHYKQNWMPYVVFLTLLVSGLALYITAALTDGSDALEQAATALVGAAVGGAGGLLSAKNGK